MSWSIITLCCFHFHHKRKRQVRVPNGLLDSPTCCSTVLPHCTLCMNETVGGGRSTTEWGSGSAPPSCPELSYQQRIRDWGMCRCCTPVESSQLSHSMSINLKQSSVVRPHTPAPLFFTLSTTVITISTANKSLRGEWIGDCPGIALETRGNLQTFGKTFEKSFSRADLQPSLRHGCWRGWLWTGQG